VKKSRLSSVISLCLGSSIALWVNTAAAIYPEKPIRLVVPFPPGGATDVIGRTIAEKLRSEIGQQVIVDNRAGASGSIGAEMTAKAAPDGYTLLMATLTTYSTMAVLERGSLRYDLAKDFTPIIIVGSVPLVVVVNPNVPAKTLRELLDYAKANPNKLSYASSGPSSVQRMGAEILQREAGIKMLHVPYKGSAPAMADLMGGQVDVLVDTVPAVQSFVKSGKMRALAVAVPDRVPMLPDVPTTREAGLASLDVSSLFGVLAPVATPTDIVNSLNKALVKVVGNPDVREQFLKQGVIVQKAGDPTQSALRLRSEQARWEKLIKDANIKADN